MSSIPFRIHINSGNNDNSALLLIIKIFSVRDQICKWIFSFRVRIYTSKVTMAKNAKSELNYPSIIRLIRLINNSSSTPTTYSI